MIEPTAKELGMDSTLVDIIVTAYWNELRRELSSLNSSRISIPNFGIFVVMPGRLKGIQSKYQGYLDKKSEKKGVKTFKRYSYVYYAKEYIAKIDLLLKNIETEKERRFKIINDKTNGNIVKNNLESKNENS